MQDDDDGHLVVLTIIEELMNKTQDEFLDHFARLGVFSKVQSLVDSENENDIKQHVNSSISAVSTTTSSTDEQAPTATVSCGTSGQQHQTQNGIYFQLSGKIITVVMSILF